MAIVWSRNGWRAGTAIYCPACRDGFITLLDKVSQTLELCKMTRMLITNMYQHRSDEYDCHHILQKTKKNSRLSNHKPIPLLSYVNLHFWASRNGKSRHGSHSMGKDTKCDDLFKSTDLHPCRGISDDCLNWSALHIQFWNLELGNTGVLAPKLSA